MQACEHVWDNNAISGVFWTQSSFLSTGAVIAPGAKQVVTRRGGGCLDGKASEILEGFFSLFFTYNGYNVVAEI